MADDGSTQSTGTWPMAKFYFKVTWGSTEIDFQEVSGLDAETQIIEYRHENSPVFSTVKMPGIAKNGNITMKKGVFKSDNEYRDWYNQVKLNTIKRIPITISLFDENGAMTMNWKVLNAWPTKITATDMKSDDNQPAVEMIEIAHEGIMIENA
jgi:phage tail-like protein